MILEEVREEVAIEEIVSFDPKKDVILVRPTLFSEAELEKQVFLHTALSHKEIMRSADGNYYTNFRVAILSKKSFKNPKKPVTFIEDVKPSSLGKKFKAMSIFEFINFSIKLKKEGIMKKSAVYVPLGTKTEAKIYSSKGLIPVTFPENILNGSIKRSLSFRGLPVVQCSQSPAIQYANKQQFFVVKIVE